MEVEHEARAALLKFAGFAVAIALVLGAGTLLLVHALGLGGGSNPRTGVSAATTGRPSQLPTVALSPSGSASPTEEPTPSPTVVQGINLAANPTQARAGQRIFLTGQYAGADGVQLQVQRETDGAWSQFADVVLTVRGGVFSTYIITTRTGAASFRLLDAATGQASNVVQVTIG